jgi:hypothetical protein
MTNDNDLIDYFANRLEDIEGWVNEGLDTAEVVSRTRQMAKGHDIDVSHEMVEEIVRGVEHRLRVAPPPQTIINVINSPNATVTVVRGAKPSAPEVKLYYLLIEDARLIFNDRIILSFLWKWTRLNRRKKNPRPISLRNVRRATGFRSASVEASLTRLREYGYTDTDHAVLAVESVVRGTKAPSPKPIFANGIKCRGYRKCHFINAGDIRWSIAEQVFWTQRKPSQNRPAWLRVALGVSRATAYRYLQKHFTDETEAVTNETRRRNG